MNKTFNKLTSFALAGALMLTLAAPAFAAAPQNASNNMTRQKGGEVSDHNFTFTMPTATTAGIDITFPVGFDTTSAVVPGGVTQVGNVFTIAGPVTANQAFDITIEGIENPAYAGTVAGASENYEITIASDVDTGSVLVPIINDDQIVITARVAQTLQFDVRDGDGVANTATDNAVGFGDLEAGSTNFATDDAVGSNATAESSQFIAGTNAPGGYIVEVTGETLTSMQNPADQIDPVANGTAAPAAGTEAFGLSVAQEVASTNVAGVISADYLNSFALPATGTEDIIVTQNVPSSEEIYDVTYIANIAALTPAGDYATVMTYTMTAQF